MLTSLISKIKKKKLGYLDGTVNTDDHDTTPLLQPSPVQPTFSVVELSDSCPAPLDPNALANSIEKR